MIAVTGISRIQTGRSLQTRQFGSFGEDRGQKDPARENHIKQAEQPTHPYNETLPRIRIQKYFHVVAVERNTNSAFQSAAADYALLGVASAVSSSLHSSFSCDSSSR